MSKIPTFPNENTKPDEDEVVSTKVIPKGSRILIMDDEEDIGFICKKILSSFGVSCEVKLALSGDHALLEIKNAIENQKSFEMIFLDLTIPRGRGGLDIIKEIRLVDQTVIVVASSGDSDAPVMTSPKDYGFDDALAKPYTKTALVNIVKKHLANRN